MEDTPLNIQKRRQNERKFGTWEELSYGGRRYWYDVAGRFGCSARYIKEVDSNETILRFYQEVYNEKGELVEVHQKYPTDVGHKLIKKEER
ncbi:MAG TPA: hypothetical protein ACFYD2_01250 [Candidatus Avalokitesvara rifleensis]|uniref:hypothetical protein n=1 Tax=Candidatus Avalokitesvara rifleensis TaxID=3367620 RepID=UPI0027127C61|nr:hypothetical protein [Candidatus Brocadiales bacterium]